MFSSVLVKTGALTALRFVLNLGTGLFKHQKSDSLVSFTQQTRVEPITMIDQRAIALPYLHDVLQAVNSIFIGYYLQAVSMLVQVGNINVLRLLDTLNPDRDVKGAANAYIVDNLTKGKPSMLSLESYQFALPVPAETASLEDREQSDKAKEASKHLNQTSNYESPQTRMNRKVNEHVDKLAGQAANYLDDAITDATGKDGPHVSADHVKNLVNPLQRGAGDMHQLASNAHNAAGQMVQSGANFKEIDAAKEATNLSVGKLISVEVQQGQHKASFPISIRLIATIIASNVLSHILGDGSRDVTAKERYHAWRSGQLDFWRDLVFAQDLIDERRKALMKDETGTYAEILKRRAGNAAAGVMSATPSIGTASNIVVLTSQTAKDVELSIGGHLSDPRARQKVFNNTYIMLMVVIDPEWEQVTIYHRGIALPTKLSVKELKVANKGTGPDVGEILKAYQLGNNPTI